MSGCFGTFKDKFTRKGYEYEKNRNHRSKRQKWLGIA